MITNQTTPSVTPPMTSPSDSFDNRQLCQLGRQVIQIETRAIAALDARIGDSYASACRLLLACRGRAVLIGMGKSGHIARKIAATLASTGTASYFVHPAEACHGDLGMLAADDVIIAISNSGETQEILTLLPNIKLLDLPLIALTGNPRSTLAGYATSHLDISVEKEACPLGLAPTSSTTAALVIGDALAITLLQARGFKANDFARYHPSGTLGRRLLLKVDTLMHTGTDFPCVKEDCMLSDALYEMTQKSLGMTTIVDDQQRLSGIFTDGDLRRALDLNLDIRTTPIQSVMTPHCVTVTMDILATEALQLMEQHKITALVITSGNKPIGVVHMHDILRAGIG